MTSASATAPQPTLFGHPAGLFTLFFAEMWERFSYYGMRALLLFYMIKGFLGYGDTEAYGVYGAYTAMVYATPFIGGMLADRLLGARRAVILGGSLMAAGHLLMTWENQTAFFMALALLIAGNGFFKPNISTIVGGLYSKAKADGDHVGDKRDAGFTIFYMGINLGAAMSPLLCGYVGETYGWHYGFGLATIGMLIGLAVFVAPVRITQILILLGALGSAAGLVLIPDSTMLLIINGFVAAALVAAAIAAFVALGRGGLSKDAGRPKKPSRLKELAFPQLRAHMQAYYLAIIGAILLAQYVVPPHSAEAWALVAVGAAALIVPWLSAVNAVYVCVLASVPVFAMLVQRGEAAAIVLALLGVLAVGSIVAEALRSTKVERERIWVIFILMFFSLLFWSFFEQAGSSVNNFTDRNVDRVAQSQVVQPEQVGQLLQLTPTQEQLGYSNAGDRFLLNDLEAARKARQKAVEDELPMPTVGWTVTEDQVGMGLAEPGEEIPASVFQSANPIFIILFGLLFTGLWGFLSARGREPSIPVKFALGILQLGLGFGCFWYGAQNADDRGMVWVGWLLGGYLLQTTGELCLSPVGLSMVTKLSPRRIVSTIMGSWFLATAFSNLVASAIAALTGVGHGADGESAEIPAPIETVDIYGDVFLKIAIAAIVSAVLLFLLAPLLNKWMHPEEPWGDEVPDDEPSDEDGDGDGDDVDEAVAPEAEEAAAPA